jgi:toxin-antitoxin system PIN domain toxin
VKLPDVNIWLALALSGHSHHAAARDWLDEQEATASVFFCRATQQGLLRLLTTAEVMTGYGIAPCSNREAWGVYERFMADERISMAHEPVGWEDAWRAYAVRDSHSPKLWMDAGLAAFALRAGFQMVTTDKAFSQFKGLDLRWVKAG